MAKILSLYDGTVQTTYDDIASMLGVSRATVSVESSPSKSGSVEKYLRRKGIRNAEEFNDRMYGAKARKTEEDSDAAVDEIMDILGYEPEETKPEPPRDPEKVKSERRPAGLLTRINFAIGVLNEITDALRKEDTTVSLHDAVELSDQLIEALNDLRVERYAQYIDWAEIAARTGA